MRKHTEKDKNMPILGFMFAPVTHGLDCILYLISSFFFKCMSLFSMVSCRLRVWEKIFPPLSTLAERTPKRRPALPLRSLFYLFGICPFLWGVGIVIQIEQCSVIPNLALLRKPFAPWKPCTVKHTYDAALLESNHYLNRYLNCFWNHYLNHYSHIPNICFHLFHSYRKYTLFHLNLAKSEH